MAGEEHHLNLLNRFLEEAVSLHGGDVEKVVDYVRTKLDAAAPEDRVMLEKLLKRILLFQPSLPGRTPLH